MDDYSSAKVEVERLLGLDIKAGDKLRRINLPQGWPQQELVVHEVKQRFGEQEALCSCSPPIGLAHTVTIGLRNLGVLYERVFLMSLAPVENVYEAKSAP